MKGQTLKSEYFYILTREHWLPLATLKVNINGYWEARTINSASVSTIYIGKFLNEDKQIFLESIFLQSHRRCFEVRFFIYFSILEFELLLKFCREAKREEKTTWHEIYGLRLLSLQSTYKIPKYFLKKNGLASASYNSLVHYGQKMLICSSFSKTHN